MSNLLVSEHKLTRSNDIPSFHPFHWHRKLVKAAFKHAEFGIKAATLYNHIRTALFAKLGSV